MGIVPLGGICYMVSYSSVNAIKMWWNSFFLDKKKKKKRSLIILQPVLNSCVSVACLQPQEWPFVFRPEEQEGPVPGARGGGEGGRPSAAPWWRGGAGTVHIHLEEEDRLQDQDHGPRRCRSCLPCLPECGGGRWHRGSGRGSET
jgi:hypothetical protein